MEKLIPFTVNDLSKITNYRSGEKKFGEKILTFPKNTDVIPFLQSCEAKYVLFGIPEDIGVRANFGRPGTASAWENALKSIVNIQHNRFCKGDQLLILGKLDVEQELAMAASWDKNEANYQKKLSEIVVKIDKEVAHIVFNIVKSGKIPIIIGGGHNNAYGNIKGTALAKGHPIHALNFDAHTDFRSLEGRHSGNGFTYAYEEGFLNNYFIFGIHESYTSKSVLDAIKKTENRVQYNTYEEIKIRHEKHFMEEMGFVSEFLKNESFGLEIDLDAIANVASSAMTLSGFSVEEARQFVHFFGKSKKVSYLHICEGAPDLDTEKNSHLIGKLIGYLVTDFIKAHTLPTIEKQLL